MAKMWFGTREYMQFIECPAINYAASKQGFDFSGAYLNGGAWSRRSTAAAKTYNFTWNMKRRDEVRPITDYADGVYGSGAIYFVDPFAMDKNLLPQYWATPSINAIDGPIVLGATRPATIATTDLTLGYPVKTAVYNAAGGESPPPLYLPVPPGYSLWLGVHGTATGDHEVRVIPYTSPTNSVTAEALTMLDITDTTRVIDEFSSDDYVAVELTMGGTTGSLALTGLMAQLYPTGVTPPTGGFISGQGHSGCSFSSQPSLSQYSAALDRVGVSVNLVETEVWEY